MIKITIRRREKDFHASIEGTGETWWGCGRTKLEAIGDAVCTHAAKLGIQIVEWQDYANHLGRPVAKRDRVPIQSRTTKSNSPKLAGRARVKRVARRRRRT